MFLSGFDSSRQRYFLAKDSLKKEEEENQHCGLQQPSSFSSTLWVRVPPVAASWNRLGSSEISRGPGPNTDYFHLSLQSGVGWRLQGIGSFHAPQAIPACRQVGEMVLLDPSAATVKSIWGAVTLFSA